MSYRKRNRVIVVSGLIPLLFILFAGYELMFDTKIAKASAAFQQPVINPAGPIIESMDEDDPGTFDVSLGTTGALTSTLSWSVSQAPAHGSASVAGLSTTYGVSGTLGYTPDANYNGNDTFVVQVLESNNNLTDTVTVDVTIEPVDDGPPVITESDPKSVTMSEDGDPTDFNLTLNATEPDGDTITWSIETQASNGTATASGTGTSKSIGYAPDPDYNGIDSFVVKVVDSNNGEDTITVNVTIDPVNDDPVIAGGNPVLVTMSENGSPNPFILTLNASDKDGDFLVWSIKTQASNGTASASGGGPSKSIGYTPDPNYNGSDSFVVRVADGNGGEDTVTVNVTIEAVNEKPVISEGNSVSVTMSEDGDPTEFSLTLNASDRDGDTLTWSIKTEPSNGNATASGIGESKRIGYSPNENYNGSDGFVVKVEDGNGGEDTIVVNVTIEPINDDPADISLSSTSVAENRPIGAQVGVLSTTDVDGGPNYVYDLVGNSPDNDAFMISGDKLKTAVVLDREIQNSYSIRIETNDGNGGVFAKNFTISVSNVNEPDLSITKSDGGLVAAPDGVIIYELDYANIGNETATGVRIIETVPDHTTFDEDNSTSDWSCPDNSPAGTECRLNLGTLKESDSGTAGFAVTVNSPIPGNVTEIANTATISANQEDPDLINNSATEVTPLDSDVTMDVSKQGVLLIDADASGVASPGDTLRYTITTLHSGTTTAVDTILTDTPDPNLILLPDSLETTAGLIVTGDEPGDKTIQVDIGTVPISGVVTVTYEATIRNPLLTAADEIVNQAFVEGSNFPTTPSDDPRLPGDEDATTIPLSARVELFAIKVDKLEADAEINGFASPGETIAYSITVVNTGNRVATSVVLTDVIDSNADLVVGSVMADCTPTSIVGNTPGDTVVQVDIGNLAGGGGECTIRFDVRIKDTVSANAKEIRNQAFITSAETESIGSDDPDLPGDQDVTRTTLFSRVNLFASLNVFLHNDNEGDGRAGPGDVLLYTVRITNIGNRAAANVTYEVQLGSQVSTLSESVVAGVGEVTAGNAADSQSVVVQVGELQGAGGVEEISYKVRINNVIGLEPVEGVPETDSKWLISQGKVTYRDLETGALLDILTDYPAQPGDDDPTPVIVHGAEAIFLPAAYR